MNRFYLYGLEVETAAPIPVCHALRMAERYSNMEEVQRIVDSELASEENRGRFCALILVLNHDNYVIPIKPNPLAR